MNKYNNVQETKQLGKLRQPGKPGRQESAKLKLQQNFYSDTCNQSVHNGDADGDGWDRVRSKYNRSEHKGLMRMVKKIYLH